MTVKKIKKNSGKKVNLKKLKKKTKNISSKEKKVTKKEIKKSNIPTLKLLTDHEIAIDFSAKLYNQFGNVIKSVILFGSVQKKTMTRNSDIDLIVLLDDVSVKWSEELVAWYREELSKLMQKNPYIAEIHINTIKLSTWWDGLLKGDPVVLNAIRYGFPVLDYAGFVEPLKALLIQGKITGTPESIYGCIQRAPAHIARSKFAELSAIDGVYWSMVDSSHAALIAAGQFPPSPEHITKGLKEVFVDRNLLKLKYVIWYRDLFDLHKKIDHKEITDLKGVEIDVWQERAEEFMKVMVDLVEKIINKQK